MLLEERRHLQGLLDLRQSAQVGLLRFKSNREQQALPGAHDFISYIVSSGSKLVLHNRRDGVHLGTSHHIRKLKQHCSVNICFLRFSWNYSVVLNAIQTPRGCWHSWLDRPRSLSDVRTEYTNSFTFVQTLNADVIVYSSGVFVDSPTGITWKIPLCV